jgi:Tfp pilus assembly protein PilF
MGKLYLISDESDKALEIVAKVLAKDPNNIDALLLQAAVLMRTGEIEQSQEILKA